MNRKRWVEQFVLVRLVNRLQESSNPFAAKDLQRLQPSFGLWQRVNQLGRLREFPELLRVARSGGDYLLSYREQWKRFAAAVRGEKPPASSFVDGLTALKVAHAALKSREDGMLATVPD